MIRKIADSWMQRLPVVTTPVGSEGMYLQSLDNNWSIERLRIENKDEFGDKRFYKPVFEPLKVFNQDIVDFYSYEDDKTCQNAAEKLTFGGSFNNFS